MYMVYDFTWSQCCTIILLLYLFCIFFPVTNSMTRAKTKDKWINGLDVDDSGTSRIFNMYVDENITIGGAKLGISTAKHLEVLFGHKLPPAFTIASSGYNISTAEIFSATLYNNKPNVLKLNSSLKINGKSITFYKRSNVIFVRSLGDSVLDLRLSEVVGPALRFEAAMDNKFTLHLNSTLLVKHGIRIIPKYISSSSESIYIPKTSTLVYILGNREGSGVKLPASTSPGYRVEIFREKGYVYNIGLTNSSTYRINDKTNQTVELGTDTAKIECSTNGEMLKYICVKTLFSGARDSIENPNDYWHTVLFTGTGVGTKTLTLTGNSHATISKRNYRYYMPDVSGTIITTGNFIDINGGLPSNSISVLGNLRSKGEVYVKNSSTKRQITLNGIVRPINTIDSIRNETVLSFEGSQQSIGTTRILKKKSANVTNNMVLFPDVSGTILTTGNLKDIIATRLAVTSLRVLNNAKVNKYIQFNPSTQKESTTTFMNAKAFGSLILGIKGRNHKHNKSIKAPTIKWSGTLYTLCSGIPFKAEVQPSSGSQKFTHVRTSVRHNLTSGNIIELLHVENIDTEKLYKSYFVDKIDSYNLIVNNLILDNDHAVESLLKCVPALSFQNHNNHNNNLNLLFRGTSATIPRTNKQNIIQIPNLNVDQVDDIHNIMLSSGTDFSAHFNFSSQNIFGNLKLMKDCTLGKNTSTLTKPKITFNASIQSGACGMQSVSVKYIKRIDSHQFIIHTSTVHTFRKLDNVYIGPREGVEDKFLTFIITNVSNTAFYAQHAYPKDNIFQSLPSYEESTTNHYEYIVRCRAAIVFDGNTTISVQQPLKTNQITISSKRISAMYATRWITSGNLENITKIGDVYSVTTKQNILLHGDSIFGTQESEILIDTRGPLSIKRAKSVEMKERTFLVQANVSNGSNMVLFKSNSVKHGAILNVSGTVQNQNSSNNVKVVHINSNKQISGTLVKLSSNRITGGSILRVQDQTILRSKNSTANVCYIKSMANSKQLDGNLSRKGNIVRVKSMNCNGTVSRIDGSGIQMGALVGIDSINGSRIQNGISPGSLLQVSGNNQKSGLIMSLGGEDITVGTVLRVEKNNNVGMLNNNHKLLHVRTSSPFFSNAVVISQELVNKENASIVSIRSKSNAQGTLLKVKQIDCKSNCDANSELSHLLSINAAVNHRQGTLLDINGDSLFGVSPIALKISEGLIPMAETSNTLLHVESNSINLDAPVVSMRGYSARNGCIVSIFGVQAPDSAVHSRKPRDGSILKVSSTSTKRDVNVPIALFASRHSNTGHVMKIAHSGRSNSKSGAMMHISSKRLNYGEVVYANIGETNGYVGNIMKIETVSLSSVNDEPLVSLGSPNLQDSSIFRVTQDDVNLTSNSTYIHIQAGGHGAPELGYKYALLKLTGDEFTKGVAIRVNTEKNENTVPISIKGSSRIFEFKSNALQSKSCILCLNTNALESGTSMFLSAPNLQEHGSIIKVMSNKYKTIEEFTEWKKNYGLRTIYGDIVTLQTSSHMPSLSLHKTGDNNKAGITLNNTLKEIIDKEFWRSSTQLRLQCVGYDINASCSGLVIKKNKNVENYTGNMLDMKFNYVTKNPSKIQELNPNVTLINIFGRSSLNDLVSIKHTSNHSNVTEGDSPAAGLWISSTVSESLVLKHTPGLQSNENIASNNTKAKLLFLKPNKTSISTDTTILGTLSFQGREKNRKIYSTISMLEEWRECSIKFETSPGDNTQQKTSMIAEANVLSISHNGKFMITRSTKSSGNGNILIVQGQSSKNKNGGSVILVPGTSTNQILGNINISQGFSNVQINGPNMKFENLKFKSKRDVMIRVPVATVENLASVTFNGGSKGEHILSLNQGKIANKVINEFHVEYNVKTSRDVKTLSSLRAKRLIMKKNKENQGLNPNNIILSTKMGNSIKITDKYNRVITSMHKNINISDAPNTKMKGSLLSYDTKGILVKSKLLAKYINTEREINFKDVLPRSMVFLRRIGQNNEKLHLNFQNVNITTASWQIFMMAEPHKASQNNEILLSFRKGTKLIINVKMYTKHPTKNVIAIMLQHTVTSAPPNNGNSILWARGDSFVFVCKNTIVLPGSHLKINKMNPSTYTIKGKIFHDTNEDAEHKFAGDSDNKKRGKEAFVNYYNSECLFRRNN